MQVFATSISIILSTLCSYLILDDLQTGPLFLVGAPMVILSTVIYGKFPAASQSSTTSQAQATPKFSARLKKRDSQ